MPLDIHPEELVQQADELDALPPSTSRLAALLSSGDWDVSEVERIVRFDAVLTARLLAASNSVLVVRAAQITSVGAAIMQLGAGAVLTLAMAQSVRRLFARDTSVYGMSEEGLWRHSVACALAVDRARRICQHEIPPEAFAGALLHDVGKLVIARYVPPDALAEIRRARERDGQEDVAAETLVLGFDHAQLGGLIVADWHLPAGIVDAVAAHHSRDRRSARRAAGPHVVRLADGVAHAVTAGLTPASVARFDRPEARAALGVVPEDFGRLCLRTAGDLETVLELYE